MGTSACFSFAIFTIFYFLFVFLNLLLKVRIDFYRNRFLFFFLMVVVVYVCVYGGGGEGGGELFDIKTLKKELFVRGNLNNSRRLNIDRLTQKDNTPPYYFNIICHALCLLSITQTKSLSRALPFSKRSLQTFI